MDHHPTEGMNAALRTVHEELRKLLGQAARDEVAARFQAGRIIADVKRTRGKYGAQAVRRLAEALGHDEQTLYRYATVAERWSQADFKNVLERRNSRGMPLSWSHVVLLSSIESTPQRTRWTDHALRDALSVRELSRAMAADRLGDVQDGPAEIVAQLVHRVYRYFHDIRVMHEELCRQLAAAADRGGGEELLEKAIAAEEALFTEVRGQLERLRMRYSLLDGREDDSDRRLRPVRLAGMPTLKVVPRSAR